MTQTPPDQAPDTLASPLFLDVHFSFATSWNIAPTGRLSGFPPGGGLAARRIDIGPVDLAGLGSDEVARIVRTRAADMALLAKAIAAADSQFADALQAAAT